MEIKLKYPIDGVDKIVIRRPKVKDILKVSELQASDAEKELILLESLTGISKDKLKELDIYDYAQLQKAYTNFLKE